MRLGQKQRLERMGKVMVGVLVLMGYGWGGLGCDGGLITPPIGGNRDGGTSFDGPGGDVGPPTLESLRITPDNQVLQVDLGQVEQLTFHVVAVYSDGGAQDVTGTVQLALVNQAVGQFSGATFNSAVKSTTQVAFSRVQAQLGSAIGMANLTVVWLQRSGAQPDFFFNLPYQAGDQTQPLSFSTRIQSIDSFFAVDTTGSMDGEILNLQSSLQNQIIPGVRSAAVRDAWFGVGAIDDFPVNPYGVPNSQCNNSALYPDDQPFFLLQPMNADVTLAQAAVGQLRFNNRPRGCGLDIPEGQIEGLYQVATGAGNMVPGVVNVPAHSGLGRGGAEFRDGALPVVTLITDASFHTKGEPTRACNWTDGGGSPVADGTAYAGSVAAAAHTRTETVTALKNLCARVIGVSSLDRQASGITFPDNCLGTNDLIQMAKDTGAVVPPGAWDLPQRPANCGAGLCCTGLDGVGEPSGTDGLCPLVFKIRDNGTGLGSQVTAGITQLARYASFEVVTDKSGGMRGDAGETLPVGRTTADFIKSVIPLDATAPPAPPVIAAPVISGNQFVGVVPGSVVRFTIDARNDFQPEADGPQVFRATIRVRAGGCADLDERAVIILVPPRRVVVG